MDKVYCKNCVRWYGFTDQCEIPSCGISNDSEFAKATGKEVDADIEGQNFIKNHLRFIHFCDSKHKKIYGHPTELNKYNDCYFYKTVPKFLRWLIPILRDFY